MKVFWEDSAKTILVREFPETWEWDEYRESIQAMQQMLQAVNHGVFVIIDARRIKMMPKDSLSHLSEGNRYTPANVLIRILVTTNRVALLIYAILMRIFPERFENYFIVSSMADAHAKIERTKQQT